MQRTRIEFVLNPDSTQGFNWGIMTGCLHPCSKVYCYNTMKSTAPLNRFYKKNREKESGVLHIAKLEEGNYPYGFDPTYYRYRLGEPMRRKKSSMIFVANAADVMGTWVPDKIINQILDLINLCSQHTFILLTKNFQRLYGFQFPDNAWVGFSVDHSAEVDMSGIKAKTKFISYEPLHYGFGFDSRSCESGQTDGYRRIGLHGVNWIVIGAESGPRADQMKPKRDWVMTLVKSAQDKGIAVWMKNNLAPYPFHKANLIQELPGRIK